MKRSISFLVAVFSLLASVSRAEYSGPELKMPLGGGNKWKILTKVNDPNDQFHQGRHYYSLDLGRKFKNGNDEEIDSGHEMDGGVLDVVAAADGKVIGTVGSCELGEPPSCPHGMIIRTACAVYIDHGGGYATKYLHLTEGSVVVVPGQQVKQGQKLGKMGNTGTSCGTHTHFQVMHDEPRPVHPSGLYDLVMTYDGKTYHFDSSFENPALENIKLDGVRFVDLEVQKYYRSTNGFDYPSTADNPHTCVNQPTGSAATGWIYTCSKSASFNLGDSVWGNAWIENITKDFCVSAQLFKSGATTPEYTEPEWCSSGVEPWGWSRSYLMPWTQPKTSGAYEIHFRVRLKVNPDYPPVPLAVSKFSVISPLPYKYTGYGITCADQPTGGAATGWVYTCANPTTNFSLGATPTVYTLLKLDQVCEDFKISAEVYKDGVLQWTDDPASFIAPGGCWNNYYHTLQARPWTIGTWQIKTFLTTTKTSRTHLKDLNITMSL